MDTEGDLKKLFLGFQLSFIYEHESWIPCWHQLLKVVSFISIQINEEICFSKKNLEELKSKTVRISQIFPSLNVYCQVSVSSLPSSFLL